MSDATPAVQFTPTRHPVGKVIYHLPGSGGIEELDGHTRWVARTKCGRLTWRSWAHDVEPGEVDGYPPADVRETAPGTYSRLDHARLLGPLCQRCEAAP